MFSYEHFELFKNIYFKEYLQASASVVCSLVKTFSVADVRVLFLVKRTKNNPRSI